MTYTIEQIRNFILAFDSEGDIISDLTHENIMKANEPTEQDTEGEDPEFDSDKNYTSPEWADEL
jgi:hypothetical protein